MKQCTHVCHSTLHMPEDLGNCMSQRLLVLLVLCASAVAEYFHSLTSMPLQQPVGWSCESIYNFQGAENST